MKNLKGGERNFINLTLHPLWDSYMSLRHISLDNPNGIK